MRISLAAKIILMFAGMVAVYTGISVVWSYQSRALKRSMDAISRDYAPLGKSLAQLENTLTDFTSTLDHVLTLPDSREKPVIIGQMLPESHAGVARALGATIAELQRLSLTTTTEERRVEAQALLDELAGLRRQHERMLDNLKPNTDIPPALRAELKERAHAERRAAKVLSQRHDRALRRYLDTLMDENDRVAWFGLGLSGVAGILALLAAFYANVLLRPLKRLTRAAQHFGEGEYHTAVSVPERQDELGMLAREFETMRLSLIGRDRALKEQAEKLELSNLELGSLTLHYENILDNLRFPVLVADVHGRLKTVNPVARRLFGLPDEGWRGRPLAELPTRQGPLGEVLDIAGVLGEGRLLVREAVRFSGERLVTLRAAPLREGERVKGLFVLGDDVTEALKVKDRVLDSERDSAADQIGAKIAHEIRNPLSSIALNVELLSEELEGIGNADLSPLVASILREIERLQGITESYLGRGRARTGERRPVDLNTMLTHLSEFYQAEFSRRGVDSRLDLSTRSAWVLGDENQVVRVVHNLIKNALDAMPEGGSLTLRSEVQGERCRLHVEDSGAGIPEAIRERIFDPFFTTKEDGTGLGLALAQQIVESMSGTIGLAPAVRGSHFILDWPLTPPPAVIE